MRSFTFIALLFLLGCAGSPKVTVNKNVTITIADVPDQVCAVGGVFPIWINVEYTTKSDLDTKLEVEQDIKPKVTIPLPGL